jgi:hypothetical protein
MRNPLLLPPYLLTTALAAAKLAGPLATLPWVWVFSPIWLPLAVYGAANLVVRRQALKVLNEDPAMIAKLQEKLELARLAAIRATRRKTTEERHSDYDPL